MIMAAENPPAFPVIAENGLGHVSDGMTLRDWFAGQALVGECAAQGDTVQPVDWIVKRAYAFADAMLAARGQ